MRKETIVVLVASSIALSGCVAALKGRPELPVRLAESSATSPYATEVKRILRSANDAQAGYRRELGRSGAANTELLKLFRNDYGYSMLAIYELTFQHYAQRLQVEARGGAFALSATETGLNFASSVITNVATKDILAGLVAALTSFESNYNSELIVNSTITVILNNMLAEQTTARKAIIGRFEDDVISYPMSALELDLAALASVVTMEKALSQNVQNSQKNLKEAQDGTSSQSAASSPNQPTNGGK